MPIGTRNDAARQTCVDLGNGDSPPRDCGTARIGNGPRKTSQPLCSC